MTTQAIESFTASSAYLRTALDPKKVRARAKKGLQGVQFDTVVGTGLSGLLPLHILGEHFKVYTLAVRKVNDGSHGIGLTEGTVGLRWLFVDDFISTGNTFIRTYKTVMAACKNRGFATECVGAFLYGETPEHYFTPMEDLLRGERGWATKEPISEAVADEDAIAVKPKVIW